VFRASVESDGFDVEPIVGLLFEGGMAFIAMLLEDGLYLACKVHGCRNERRACG
jgi:hypothetical protein